LSFIDPSPFNLLHILAGFIKSFFYITISKQPEFPGIGFPIISD